MIETSREDCATDQWRVRRYTHVEVFRRNVARRMGAESPAGVAQKRLDFVKRHGRSVRVSDGRSAKKLERN